MVYLLGRVISFSRSWPLSRQADKVQACSVEVGVDREDEINESGGNQYHAACGHVKCSQTKWQD